MHLDAEIVDKKNLTTTEAKVLVELCCAKQSKGIANALGMSIKRVEKHIDSIYEKLGVRWLSINKRSAAILIAIQTGMVKTVLHSIVAVLIFQAGPVQDDSFTRARIRLPRVMRIRSKDS